MGGGAERLRVREREREREGGRKEREREVRGKLFVYLRYIIMTVYKKKP